MHNLTEKIRDRINIYIPLFCGCVIYFFFKQDDVLRKFENYVPLLGLLRNIFFIEFYPKTMLGIFFMNHLCDFLWAYSLNWACILSRRDIIKGSLMALVFCAINEFIQLTPYISASFDWLDLLYEIIAIVLASFFYSFCNKR